MKRFFSVFLLFALLFACAAAGFDIFYLKKSSENLNSRNVTVNRINAELNELIGQNTDNVEDIIAGHIGSWRKKYGKYAPDSMDYIPIEGKGIFRTSTDSSNAVCAVSGSGSDIIGFVEYTYNDKSVKTVLLIVNSAFAAAFLIAAAAMMYIWSAVLVPFRRLSDYPERLARLRDIQKLPESRSRFFGRYIWGMNMLSDVLSASSRKIHSLEGEHQKLVTTIAHGVKTPIANIRLYTDAVRTGLYSGQGMTDEIADRIDQNTAKIEKMAAELMAASAASCGGYDIELASFNIKELAELVYSEFKDRMKLKRIPFSVKCETECIIESDKYALYRAVSQMLENAVKYGDGNGISVSFMKQDEGLSISVRNRGELLPEKELPYVFRSYWRGSNAAEKEGSGIGLYAVHESVRSLGGTVHARRLEDTSEMEFVIFIEK